jgi:hypothetical protein
MKWNDGFVPDPRGYEASRGGIMKKSIVSVDELNPNELRDLVGALVEHLNLKIVRTYWYDSGNEVEVMSEEDAEQYKEPWQR